MAGLFGMDANLIVALDALLRERNVTRAAVAVGLGQPAMSHALSKLRLHFDDPLLVREGREYRLSARAQRMVAPVEEAVRCMTEVLRPEDDFDPKTATRPVVLACTDLVALLIMPGLLQAVAQLAPGIRVMVRPLSGPTTKEMLSDVDLAFGAFAGVAEGVRIERLFEERYACVVRARHPVLTSSEWSLERYVAWPHLVVAPLGHRPRRVDDALAEHAVVRKVTLEVPHYVLAPIILQRTDHILTVSERLAQHMTDLADVRWRPPPIDLPNYTISQIWEERRENEPALKWLRRMVKQVCADLDAD